MDFIYSSVLASVYSVLLVAIKSTIIKKHNNIHRLTITYDIKHNHASKCTKCANMPKSNTVFR